MVPQDRAADDTTELIASIRRLLQARSFVERLLAVERAVAEELVPGTVEGIRTGLRDDIDDRGARASVLGGRTAGLDAKSLHGPLAQLIRNARGSLLSRRIAGDA